MHRSKCTDDVIVERNAFRMATGGTRQPRFHLHQTGFCQPFRQDVFRFPVVFDQYYCLDITALRSVAAVMADPLPAWECS